MWYCLIIMICDIFLEKLTRFTLNLEVVIGSIMGVVPLLTEQVWENIIG
jgi:hypothetical protein